MKKRIVLGSGFAFGFDISVKNMLGVSEELALDESKSKENNYVFISEHPEYTLEAYLSVDDLGKSSCVRVGCSIKNLVGFDIVYTLAIYDSITVRLYPENDPSEVFGNYFHIAEKTDCWTFPFFSDSLNKLKVRTVSLVWKDNETYHQMMPLVHKILKIMLKKSMPMILRLSVHFLR